MNPLNRRMFRQPGMSRQPAGILASSPQLANTVANRQPVRMANGGTNTYTAAVQRAVQAGDKRSLQELAKPINYGAAARTPDGQNALRLATQALAQSTQISTDTAIDAPVSFAERGIQGPPNIDAMGNVNTSNDDAMQAAMQANVDTSGPSLLDRGIAAVRDAIPDAKGYADPPSTTLTPRGIKERGALAMGLEDDPNLRSDLQKNIDASISARLSDDGAPPQTEAEKLAQGSSTFGTARPVATTLDPGAQAEADAALPETTIDPATQDPGVRAGVIGSEGGKKTKPKELKPLIDKPTIDLLTKGSLDTPQKSEQALTTGNAIVDKALAILQGSDAPKSEKVKAKALDETIGITGTYKERVAKRKAVLQDLLGERAKDVRTDANYNLMMTGLMIAAGESPDAMVNLAKGLAAGLKGYGDAVGEEAKEISKEDRALTIQSAAEVGAEISSEKAAAIKAEENRIAREHESKMQDTRLATAIVQTGMQTDSAQQIALANIRSKEQLSANSFEQNLKLFELKTDASDDMFEKEAKLKKELLDIKANQKSETFQLMEVFKNSATARGQELTDMEAYIAVKAAGTAKGKATDTTLAYQKLTAAGMSTMDAWLLSQSGSVKAIIADLGVNGFEKFVQGKLQGGDSGQGASNEIAKPTNNEEFEALAPGTRYIDPNTGTQFIK